MAPKSVTFRRHDHLVSVLFGDLFSHSYNITFSMFLPRACMRSRGRVFGLSVSLFVCLSVCPPLLACLRIQGILKGSLYTQQVDQVEKVAYRLSAIEKNGLEARKTLVLTRG